MSKQILSWLPKALFQITILLSCFLAGSFLALQGIHPFQAIEKGLVATASVTRHLLTPRFEMLRPIVYEEDGLTINDTQKSYSGYTALQGWFSGGAQVKLLDEQAKLIHQWPIDFFKIFPSPTHIYPEKNSPKGKYNFHSQGFQLLTDGSLVATISNMGTFKMDACSNVIWTVPNYGHHSVTMAEDGSFWIPDQRDARKIPETIRYRWITDESLIRNDIVQYENLVSHISADGKLIKQFSVLQALIDAKLGDQLHDALRIDHYDPVHLNSIKLVNKALAKKLKGVNEGDLLLSLRNLHMLAIMDAQTGQIKWYKIGPWIRQHDPEITANGNILVFNNRALRIDLGKNIGSNIIEFDPATEQSWLRYPPQASKENSFYTDIMGTVQLLPNDNLLIAESRRGRVFETDPEGNIVWQYIEHYNTTFAALISGAERYPKDYFKEANSQCPVLN